jgi:hypothetical protein
VGMNLPALAGAISLVTVSHLLVARLQDQNLRILVQSGIVRLHSVPWRHSPAQLLPSPQYPPSMG